MTDTPSTGRIVHYANADLIGDRGTLSYVPLIVVEADGDAVSGWVFANGPKNVAPFWVEDVPYDGDERKAGSWFWPRRVP